MRPSLYLCGLTGAVGLLVWVDRSPSDIANQVSLLVLLVGAAALGAAAPRHGWLSGVVIGSSIAFAHAIYLWMGISLPYPMSPRGWAGPLTLLVLVVPAVLAAYIGAVTARYAHRRRLAS